MPLSKADPHPTKETEEKYGDNSQRRRHRRHQHREARVAEAQLSQSAKARSKLQLLETFLSGTTGRSTARCRCIWLPTSSPSPTLPQRCFPLLPSSPAALWPGLSSSQSRPPPSAHPGRVRESGSTPDSCRSQLTNPRRLRCFLQVLLVERPLLARQPGSEGDDQTSAPMDLPAY
jgi:hypothetical protein